MKELLDRLAEEHYEIEVTDRFDRDVSEDAAVGAYIALIDGDHREPARDLARAVRAMRASRRRSGRSRMPHRISDLGVFELVGEIQGFIYLGQQTPGYYAKQVVASVIEYGTSLLPPFFGGLMAYDGEANIAFDCPGHQGGQFYRKSPAGQLFFKHFGEEHLPQRPVQRRRGAGRSADPRGRRGAGPEARRAVFGADKTYFVLNGTSTSNKVVASAVLKRGDLVLFDRNNHKSLHQGALVQSGAIPIYLPTARNAFGMVGAVDWDAWDEKSIRAQIRANPRVDDPRSGRGGAAVPARVHPARDLRRHGLQRAQGAREDRASVRLRALGRGLDRLQRLPPAVRGPQPDAAREASRRRCRACSRRSRCTSRARASRRPRRSTSATSTSAARRRYIEHKRFNEAYLIHASTSPFYPLFASLDVNAKVHEGKGGEMLWDRCIELGIETRKKLREIGRHYERVGRSDRERWFFDPFVPDVVTLRGSPVQRATSRASAGRTCPPT